MSQDVWILLFLFLIVRPLSVWIGLRHDPASRQQMRYLSWFGIRGIGSLYYLVYAIQRGISPVIAERLQGISIAAVALSVIAHGVSVTPLMNFYQRDNDNNHDTESARGEGAIEQP